MKNFSIWLTLSIFTAFAAFALSTQSPFALVLPVLYLAPIFMSGRMDRDSAAIWGLRLMVYALFGLLGRTPTGYPSYAYDARIFVTPGLIIGGEILLQSFRNPPKGFKFDPILIFLGGIIFLIACNTIQGHIWIMAPLYIFFTLLAMNDLRPKAAQTSIGIWAKRLSAIGVVTLLGAGAHYEIWSYRSSIMALGARILSQANIASGSEGVQIGDNPQLGSSFNSNGSTARLMQIRGSLSDAHLRGASFDDYVNGAWGPRISSRQVVSANPKQTLEEDPNDMTKQRSDTDAKITILRPTGGVVYFPLNSFALVPEGGSSFDWDRYAGPVKSEDEPPINYGIVEAKEEVDGVQITQGPLCVAPDAEQRERLLRIPESIDPKVIALAQEITIEATTEAEKAAKVVEYLFTTNKYSLDFTRSEQDPISDFILNKKSAHCQYFASAAVMMLRANGIPSRYASGFYAHEAAADGTTVVRGRDAHAWTEAYVNGVGWVTLDATPADGRADPNANPLPWYQKAVEWTQDTFTRVRTWISNLTELQIGGLVLLALLIWGAERWRQNWNKRRKLPPLPKVPAELEPLVRDFQRTLAKHGITLSDGQTWSDSVPVEWEDAHRWIENYDRLRFESSERNQEEIEALKTELEKVKKELPDKQPSTTA